MKIIVFSAIFTLAIAMPLRAAETNVFSSKESRVSYALGMMLGESWKAHGITAVDHSMLVRGLSDAMSGNKTLMTVQEMRSTLGQFQHELAMQQQQKLEALAVSNARISDAFLAKNKKKSGVVTLPDGLQYKIITKGSGPSPADSDAVTVSYVGTLIDGTVFDKSDKATLPVNGVIPGWRQALTHMKVGSHWKLFIPPHLAYGTRGRPPKIEPNAALIFNVHLLSIEHHRPAANDEHARPLTSDIIKVPSAAEMKKGAKVEIIKPQDVQKLQEQSQHN